MTNSPLRLIVVDLIVLFKYVDDLGIIFAVVLLTNRAILIDFFALLCRIYSLVMVFTKCQFIKKLFSWFSTTHYIVPSFCYTQNNVLVNRWVYLWYFSKGPSVGFQSILVKLIYSFLYILIHWYIFLILVISFELWVLEELIETKYTFSV